MSAILPASARPLPVSKRGRTCYGFQWIGQPFTSCDNCGHPYWVHSHDVRGTHADGRQAALGWQVRRIITVEAAKACRRKWTGES